MPVVFLTPGMVSANCRKFPMALFLQMGFKGRMYLRLTVWIALFSFNLASVMPARPNLVIIMTDEHNFRTLGCYRDLLPEDQAYVWGAGVAVETPNIDSLAGAGALCTSYYGTTPLCAPARASFMTGLYPHATGVPVNHVSMDDGMVTFAEVLRRQGYKTGYFGKWHLDGEAKPGWSPDRKFGWEDNRYMYNRGHWKNIIDTPEGPKVNAPMNQAGTMPTYDLGDAGEKTYPTDFFTDRTMEFIREQGEGPFCVMLSIPDPHQPDTVRPPYDTMYEHFTYEAPKTMFKSSSQTPDWIVGNEGDEIPEKRLDQKNMAGYFGMVRLIDDNVGRLLTLLREEGLEENTLVVFTTDHGDLLGEHARHNKRLPYEGSAISPLIVRYPGKIKAGKLIHSAMTSADFPVTMLSILQSESFPGKVHGRDLSTQFLNDDPVVRNENITYMRGVMGPLGPPPYWIAAFNHRFKLVIGKAEEPWLIDLEKDPDELVNYYGAPGYAGIGRRFTLRLKKLLEATADPALRDPDMARWLD